MTELQKPRVLVLLAAYNGIKWLPEQVDSILAQQGVEVSLCFSIDKSTDGTETWAHDLAHYNPNVQVLPCGRRFGGAGKNFYRLMMEADFSDFDYVSLADQDDLWLPDKLARGCGYLKREGVDAYSSNVTAFWPDGRRALIDKAQSQVEWDFLFEAAGPGCTYVMSKRLAQDIQQRLWGRQEDVDQVILHDWLFYAIARSRGYKWFIDPEPSMLYRQHASNQVGVNMGHRAFINRMKQFFGGSWMKQVALIAGIVNQQDSEFVKNCLSLRRTGFLKLALAAGRCRRRTRDQWVFRLFCLGLAILGNN